LSSLSDSPELSVLTVSHLSMFPSSTSDRSASEAGDRDNVPEEKLAHSDFINRAWTLSEDRPLHASFHISSRNVFFFSISDVDFFWLLIVPMVFYRVR
jgi:hypothetical protein